MKKLGSILLSAALLLSMAACGVSVSSQNSSGGSEGGDMLNVLNDTTGTDREDDSAAPQQPDAGAPDGEDPGKGDPNAGETNPGPADPAGTDAGGGEGPNVSGEQEMTVEEIVALVEGMLDQPVSALYEILGEPQSSDYASSCLGPGEDGNLYYDGFTVYTYREGDSEVIQGVE